jgi:hypothetical protein
MVKDKTSESISQEDVIDVLKFAQYVYSNDMFGYFTPDTNYRNIVSLNNNPKVPTKDLVVEALSDYQNNVDNLNAYSEFMEAFDMLYKRLVNYYANMLAYDVDIVCEELVQGLVPKSVCSTKDYQEDLQRVYKFLNAFDYKAEFSKVTKELLRRTKYFVWLRDSQGTDNSGYDVDDIKVTKTKRYTLQTMPQKYCKITGRWEYGYLYDFDMSYFTKPSVTLDSFDPIFRKYWSNIRGGDGNTDYKPTNRLNNRYGDFALWTQTSPDDNAWVFVADESNIASTPFLTPSIPNLLTNKEIEALQHDKDIISAKAILAGEIQVQDNQKSGSAKDAMTYQFKTLVKLLSLVKKGLTKNINAVAMPTKDPKLYQYSDSNKDMVKNQITNSVGQMASSSRMLYASDKLSETEVKNALVTDYNLVAQFYNQYNHFLNFFVNKKMRKYHFKFYFSGSTYPFMRDAVKDTYLNLLDKGIVLASRSYAKLFNMTPMAFDSLLIEGNSSKWTEKYTSTLQSIYTQSGKDSNKSNDKGGRPQVDDNEISDNGAKTRSYGDN